jgi:ABC-type lipopolysaccharide export system ATPase subunit
MRGRLWLLLGLTALENRPYWERCWALTVPLAAPFCLWERISHAPVLVAELFNIIVDLNKEGYAILLSEQNARKALQCAHRGYVFETGKIVLSGTSQELANDPGVRQAYLGGSA